MPDGRWRVVWYIIFVFLGDLMPTSMPKSLMNRGVHARERNSFYEVFWSHISPYIPRFKRCFYWSLRTSYRETDKRRRHSFGFRDAVGADLCG